MINIIASWSTEKKRKNSVANGSLKTITQNVLLDEANETIVSYAVGHRLGSKVPVVCSSAVFTEVITDSSTQ